MQQLLIVSLDMKWVFGELSTYSDIHWMSG